jgi:putative ABC transport system substrate-binding protein
VGVLIGAASGPVWGELEAVARAHGVTLLPQEVRRREDLEGAVAAAKAAGAQAILQAEYGGQNPESDTALIVAVQGQEPRLVLVPNGGWAGGLLRYGPRESALWVRGAEYVDRVLRGTPPAQLPVELVREFALSIDLQLAQIRGLTIAPSVLAQATEVTELGALLPRQLR